MSQPTTTQPAPGSFPCVADFSIAPIGSCSGDNGKTSCAKEVQACKKVLEKSGLKHSVHAMGTNVGEYQKATIVFTVHVFCDRIMVADTNICMVSALDLNRIEGEWDDIMRVLKECQATVHQMGK
jgi:uncharacterized protein YqgV (UPF0045/DUF77 family)